MNINRVLTELRRELVFYQNQERGYMQNQQIDMARYYSGMVAATEESIQKLKKYCTAVAA